MLFSTVHRIRIYSSVCRTIVNILGKGVTLESYDERLGIYSLNKSVSVLSHPNKPHEINQPSNTLLLAQFNPSDEAYIFNGKTYWLLHRLDSATSGCILLTDRKSTSDQVKQLFKQRKVHKTYIAKVFHNNIPSMETPFIWKDKIVTANRGNHLRTSISNSPLSKIAVTEARRISPTYLFKDCIPKNFQTLPFQTSLIQLSPHTGFTHQLRIQSATRNSPIIGDKVYGDFHLNKLIQRHYSIPSPRLMLHSHQIQFTLRQNGELIHFQTFAPFSDIDLWV